MSSKNDILSAIRRHTGKRYDMPELTLDAITYEDKILQFTDSLKAAGGQVVLMQPGDDINDIIRHHFPDAIRIASNLSSITCATFNPDDLDDPRELDNTDLAIVDIAVAVGYADQSYFSKVFKKYTGLSPRLYR